MTNLRMLHNLYIQDIVVFNFVMNVLSVLAAYSFFEKKPSINIDYCIENVDGQLAVIK